MAIKFKITPQSGSIEESKNINFEMDNVEIENVDIQIENATHSIAVNILNIEKIGPQKYRGIIDLNIPDHSSDNLISLFVNISEKTENKVIDICPIVFYIEGESKKNLFKGELLVDPSFVSIDDTCSVKIKYDPEERVTVSINDKRLNIITNKVGIGSISFKVKDVLNHVDISTVTRFSVNIYNSEDNFTKELFSGSYINILPSNVKTYLDPRCNETQPWVMPDYCVEPPDPIDPGPLEPVNLPLDLSLKTCDFNNCDNCPDCKNIEVSVNNDICRINNLSSTMLSNSMVLHAYTSVDSSIAQGQSNYNINRIFISKDESALNNDVVAARNVIVAPTINSPLSNKILIVVDKDIYDRVSDLLGSNRVNIIIYNDIFGYTSYNIEDVSPPDEYVADYILIVGNTNEVFTSEWLTCQYAIIYNSTAGVSPDVNISAISKLPFITDPSGVPVYITNVSIASNNDYFGSDGESYVYIIAETLISGTSKLYLYSFIVGRNSFMSSVYGWQQLTSNDSNNKNVKFYVGENNNLHIFWESDRSGTNQIYYGTIGASTDLWANTSLASIIDKQAELLQKEEKPFEYVSENILIPYNDIDVLGIGIADPSNTTGKGKFVNSWITNINGSGGVSTSGAASDNIVITGDTVSDTALAFMRLDVASGLDIIDGRYSQLNFQIEFDLLSQLSQDNTSLVNDTLNALSIIEIDNLYDEWKSKFEVEINSSFNNLPMYVYDNNRFIIGKEYSVYDRFIPMIGNYKNVALEGKGSGDNITDDFQVVVSSNDQNISVGDNNYNLRHFMIGIMPEKTRFKATNIETKSEFADRNDILLSQANDYISEEQQEIYTGKGKLIVIYNTSNSLTNPQISHAMVRKISNVFDLYDNNNFTIIVNYTKMKYYEELGDYYNVSKDTLVNYPKFLCNLTILNNGDPVFSESFMVDLTDEYRKFDIGFGIPSKGYFLSDRYFPYNTSIYEKTNVNLNFRNVNISTPTYQINSAILNLPSSCENKLDLIVSSDVLDVQSEYFVDSFNFLSYDFSNNPDISQIPVTLEGSNKSVDVCSDYCENTHISWQSNRNKYWNVFYGSSVNKTIPYRLETKITDTDSNSLFPSISVGRDGKRLIAWHDNRNDKYDIFAARAITGTSFCDENSCEIRESWDHPDVLDLVVPGSNIPSDKISFNYKNTGDNPSIDPSIIGDKFHFRIIFYADHKKEIIIHSAFSLFDSKRWFVQDDTLVPIGNNGAIIETNATVSINYVPEVLPQELAEQQNTYEINNNNFEETPLLCGVVYYIDISVYGESDTQPIHLESQNIIFGCSDVDANMWRENTDKYNWICSGQGKSDLKISTNQDQSLFPSISDGLSGYFSIVWQSRKGNINPIIGGTWDSENDMFYSSGQGLYDKTYLSEGYRPNILTDKSLNFYIASNTNDKILSYKCALPSTEEAAGSSGDIVFESFCYPGYNNILAQLIISDIVIRLYEEDVSGSLAISREKAVSVVEKQDVRIDISGIKGSYAVRVRNSDESNWGDWINIDSDIYNEDKTPANSAYFIDSDRFLIPWFLSKVNGVRRICCQVLTFFGITRTICLEIFVNLDVLEYSTKFYLDSDLTTEVNKYNGYPLVTQLKDETTGAPQDDTDIWVKVTFSEPKDYTGLTFNVIQQGISDQYDLSLEKIESSEGFSYKGFFKVYKDDGIFDKDGLGFIEVVFPDDPIGGDSGCLSDETDKYNLMLNQEDLVRYGDADSEEVYQEYLTSKIAKALTLNSFKQFYNIDDTRFQFGDPGYFRK